MSVYDQVYLEWRPETWREAVEIADELDGWFFRGHGSVEWRLQTSLERLSYVKNHDLYTLEEDIAFVDTEREILDKFKRQAHHYLGNTPPDDATLDWLSIIQHHGGPTRLLDFTASFYVAAFFALEDTNEDAVVWAFNRNALDLRFSASLEECLEQECEARDLVHKYLWKTGGKGVVAVRPYLLNERMIIQQGWFVCPLGIDISFEKNLCQELGIQGGRLPAKAEVNCKRSLLHMLRQRTPGPVLVKIRLPKPCQLRALSDLRRMNITAATLFPGIDGFARSLKFPSYVAPRPDDENQTLRAMR